MPARSPSSLQNLTLLGDLPLPGDRAGGSITRPNFRWGHASWLGLHHHPQLHMGPGQLALAQGTRALSSVDKISGAQAASCVANVVVKCNSSDFPWSTT
jgi:hypothetical protein